MTTPMPEGEGASPATSMPADDRRREHVKLARKWAYRIALTAYLPMSHPEVEQHLLVLVDQLFDALTTVPPATDRAAAAGARLVELRCVGKESLQCTVDVLAGAFLDDPDLRRIDHNAERVTRVLAALASGYADAVRSVTVDQQDSLNQALLQTLWSCERDRHSWEAQLGEVLAHSESGVAITGLDGRFVRTNASFDAMVERSCTEAKDLNLFDLIQPEDRRPVREAYEGLRSGAAERVRLRARLLRGTETVEVSLAVSVLRNGDGTPVNYATFVTNDTELALLRGQLKHQLLHDVLTGLPNRQFFTTRIERALHSATPTTLYRLDLDRFSILSDTLGPRAADTLLRSVAERLTAAVASEKAMVAHLDGARFGILVEDSPATPSPVAMVERISKAVSQPVDLDHTRLAPLVSIGIVHHPPQPMDPEELVRAADMALRQAKRKGPGQWALHDPDTDARERRAFGLAATLPEAWRGGQVHVVYQPLVRVSDELLLGVEALLLWNQPEHGSVPHARCLQLAEQTGLSGPLGRWLLRSAAEQVQLSHRFHPDLMLAINLTARQSSDPELTGVVARILDETGLRPGHLQLAMPVPALLAENGPAAGNLRRLADAGVRTAAYQFGNLPDDLVCLENLPVRTVRITPPTTQRNDMLATKAVADLVALVHLAGADTTIDNIQTSQQAARYRRAGADTGTGPAFGPTGPIEDLLTQSGPARR